MLRTDQGTQSGMCLASVKVFIAKGAKSLRWHDVELECAFSQDSLSLAQRLFDVKSLFSALVIALNEVYGVTVEPKSDTSVHVHALAIVTRKKHEERDFKFKFSTKEAAQEWVDVLRHVLAGVPLGGSCCFGFAC